MFKAALLRYDGFPSIVNLRAEEGPTDKHLAQNLRVDVENWSDWEGANLVKPLRVFGGGHTDLTTVEWELRFNMAVRGVRSNPDTPQRWDSYAQDLSSKYIAASQWVELDLPLSKILDQSGNYHGSVPAETKPYPLMVYQNINAMALTEAGLKEYIDDITTWAEDYLRPKGCYLDLEALARVAMRM